MDKIPIEIMQRNIFLNVLNSTEYNQDIREFLNKITQVCWRWRQIVLSIDFINLILSEKSLLESRPIGFIDMTPLERYKWTINKIYNHKINILQEKIPDITSINDLLKSHIIYITGNIEEIFMTIPLNPNYVESSSKAPMISIYRNLKNYKEIKKISIYINPPYDSRNNSWVVEICIKETISNGCIITNTPIHNSMVFIPKYEFKIVGDCGIRQKELWTHLLYPPIYGV